MFLTVIKLAPTSREGASNIHKEYSVLDLFKHSVAAQRTLFMLYLW